MGYSTEEAVLLACARHSLKHDMAGPIRNDMQAGVDWAALADAAERNRILLHPLLQELAVEPFVSSSAKDALARRYHAVGLRNLLLSRELTHILCACRDAGLSVIVLKGSALTEAFYPRETPREAWDIDLLVRQGDAHRAAGLMHELGYAPMPGPHSVDWHLRHRHHLSPFCKPGSNVVIEIHHALVTPYNVVSLCMDAVWDRSRETSFGAVSARVLSPEDMLIHLCLNLAYSDGFIGGLRHLQDLGMLVGNGRHHVDWARLTGIAGQSRVSRFVYYPLRLAGDLLGADIDEAAMDTLYADASVGRVADRLITRLARAAILRRTQPAHDLQLCYSRLCRELLFMPCGRPLLFAFLALLFPFDAVSHRSGAQPDMTLPTYLCRILRRLCALALRVPRAIFGAGLSRIGSGRSDPWNDRRQSSTGSV